MEKIEHIFFDLDHTLWDFDKNSELSFKQIFKEEDIRLDFTVFLKTYIPINFSYWKLYREEQVTKEELRYGRLKDTFSILKHEISDEMIHRISEHYINYLPNYNYLIDGTIELLDYLKKKYTLHIITNGFKEVQYNKLKASKIMDYFNLIVTSESVGVKKPNPKIYEFALRNVKAKAENCVMIGDNFEADILGARNIGILPIFYNPERIKYDDKVKNVNNLLEIKQFL
ncbi:YjjG family noncanonical pyrimidine nucleotidase [Tenacibaculum agarivorans]|uniref:YjjG family noncanonical pyrimidine nucleotidase n=1 Tax=Tenacibaculum agarivorans TaxID=1908389 RepID=UPI00094BBE84|nr:YjjG family noncanonical pyrimidine nucleotidase [Tenacibaculum agarivorans]